MEILLYKQSRRRLRQPVFSLLLKAVTQSIWRCNFNLWSFSIRTILVCYWIKMV